ncbi:uncharacterized protein LOC134444046 [Engraulis encrasicolus]|uniref:uncharacterized protein LOC134444046 n=1 Tax=Engraulis encrasicolus TaxID=184585 RepID=UPI002FD16E96
MFYFTVTWKMRAAISLLVLLLSMCGVQTESHGTDASTQLDVSTELKELRDMVVELRATLRHTRDDVKVLEAKMAVLEADNVAVTERLAVSESKVEALERALQDTKAEMKTEVDNLKKENAATEKIEENLEKEIKAAPKVAFSAGLKESGAENGFKYARRNNLNLVFSRVITNVGEAYCNATGFFTAPVRGVYYFRFTVVDYLFSRWMHIKMFKNGEQLMWLSEYDDDRRETYVSSGLALQLEKGDTVNLGIPAESRLYDHSEYNHSTFSGFLLFPL